MIESSPAIPLLDRVLSPRYPASRALNAAGAMLIHPIATLPVLVYLLGGPPRHIAWYAIVASIAFALAGPVGTFVAKLPGTSRVVIVTLLVVQAVGFLIAVLIGLGADRLDIDRLLRLSAASYPLLVVPGVLLARIGEQGHEFRRAAAATVTGILPAAAGTLLAGIMSWRLFETGGMGSNDLLARLLVAGALMATAAAWLAHVPTVLAHQLPHPARPMPDLRWPGLMSNTPLLRYAGYVAISGISRFADPFLLIGVLTLIAPGIAWIGGAILAFACGDVLARLIAVRAFRPSNIRGMLIGAGLLHVIAFILVAFAADILGASIVAERNPAEAWRNWSAVAAALSLGASYQLLRTGHVAYIRSITSPGTRDLSLTASGVVAFLTAFAPLIAVRLLDTHDIGTVLQIGTGASVIGLLATALVVPTYAPPRRRGGAWGLRRAMVR